MNKCHCEKIFINKQLLKEKAVIIDIVSTATLMIKNMFCVKQMECVANSCPVTYCHGLVST